MHRLSPPRKTINVIRVLQAMPNNLIIFQIKSSGVPNIMCTRRGKKAADKLPYKVITRHYNIYWHTTPIFKHHQNKETSTKKNVCYLAPH